MKYFNNKFPQVLAHNKNQLVFKLKLLTIKKIIYFKHLKIIHNNLK